MSTRFRKLCHFGMHYEKFKFSNPKLPVGRDRRRSRIVKQKCLDFETLIAPFCFALQLTTIHCDSNIVFSSALKRLPMYSVTFFSSLKSFLTLEHGRLYSKIFKMCIDTCRYIIVLNNIL